MAIQAWARVHYKQLAVLLMLIIVALCVGPSLVRFILSRFLSPSEKLDYILRSSPTCVAPCWQTIAPGRSTEADFLAHVADSSPLRFADLEQSFWSYPPNSTNYRWYDYLTGLTGDALFVNGYVNRLTFWSQGTFALGEVLTILGPLPSYFAGVYPAERTFFNADLYDEAKGIILNLAIYNFDAPLSAFKPTCQLEIGESMPIRQIIFVEPGDTATITFVTSPNPNETPYPWPGLGLIELTRCFND